MLDEEQDADLEDGDVLGPPDEGEGGALGEEHLRGLLHHGHDQGDEGAGHHRRAVARPVHGRLRGEGGQEARGGAEQGVREKGEQEEQGRGGGEEGVEEEEHGVHAAPAPTQLHRAIVQVHRIKTLPYIHTMFYWRSLQAKKPFKLN